MSSHNHNHRNAFIANAFFVLLIVTMCSSTLLRAGLMPPSPSTYLGKEAEEEWKNRTVTCTIL